MDKHFITIVTFIVPGKKKASLFGEAKLFNILVT
jgi:hypothetical protein